MVVSVSPVRGTCRTLTSAWIETIGTKLNAHLAAVALRKECVD